MLPHYHVAWRSTSVRRAARQRVGLIAIDLLESRAVQVRAQLEHAAIARRQGLALLGEHELGEL